MAIGRGSSVMRLFNDHGERLYRLLLRLTLREDVAEDLLQDLALKLSQAANFADAENPYAYARQAAVNLAFSWIRRRRHMREQPVEGSDYPSADPPPWARLVCTEDIGRVLAHLEELSERDRLILVMRYFDEVGYEEIGRAVGNTGDHARALCHKAIKRLRAAMGARDRAGLDARSEVKP